MSGLAITAGAFVGGVLLALAGYWLLFDALALRFRVNRRLSRANGGGPGKLTADNVLFKDFDQLAGSVKQEDWRKKLDAYVEQSGLVITLQQLVLVGLAGAALLAMLAFILLGWLGIPLGLGAGTVAPIWYVVRRRRARIERLRNQLPEVFEAMSRAVRAGQTVSGALQVIADDFEAPISDEFALCYEQQNLGVPQDVALRDLARRSGIMELQIFVVSLLVQRKSGGNLVELLSNLSSTIRKRIKVQAKVKSLTSEGRLQAAVLIVLPLLVLVAVFFINRDYVQVLFDHSNLLVGMLIAQAIGAAWIRKIVNVEY